MIVSPRKEKDEIVEILRFLTIKGCFVRRIETGTVVRFYRDKRGVQKSAVFHGGSVGAPDIIGVTPCGMSLNVEVKTCREMKRVGLSLQQKVWKREIEARGGIFIIADRGVEGVMRDWEAMFGSDDDC